MGTQSHDRGHYNAPNCKKIALAKMATTRVLFVFRRNPKLGVFKEVQSSGTPQLVTPKRLGPRINSLGPRHTLNPKPRPLRQKLQLVYGHIQFSSSALKKQNKTWDIYIYIYIVPIVCTEYIGTKGILVLSVPASVVDLPGFFSNSKMCSELCCSFQPCLKNALCTPPTAPHGK